MTYNKTNWQDGVTPLSAQNLNKLEVGVESSHITMIASYMAFCGNVNTNSLDAGFGKNNDDYIMNLGRQLAMYAWFKGDSKVANPFTNLQNVQNLLDLVSNQSALDELYANANLRALIELSPYACLVLSTYGTAVNRAIANADMYSFINASTNLKTAYQTNANGVASAKMAVKACGLDYTSISNFNGLLANSTLYNALIASATGMAWIYCNEMNNMKLIAYQTGQAYSNINGTAEFVASPTHLTALRSSALGLKSLVMSTNTKVLTDLHTPLNVNQTARTAVLTTLRNSNAYFNAEASVNGGHAGVSFAIPYQCQRSSGTGSSTASWSDSYGGAWSMGISGTTLYTATADIYILFKNSSCGVSPYGKFASVKYYAVKAGVI